MSSGGQRGIDVSGVTGIRIQNASDAVYRTRTRLVYQTFASTTGANAYANETPNATGSYIDFLVGKKEGCASCTGLPYQMSDVRLFRS
jgi:hypothetical protein